MAEKTLLYQASFHEPDKHKTGYHSDNGNIPAAFVFLSVFRKFSFADSPEIPVSNIGIEGLFCLFDGEGVFNLFRMKNPLPRFVAEKSCLYSPCRQSR